MKTPFLKISDQPFDNLLRAQIGRQSGSPSACPEFDPDLANAYVEHSLTPAMNTRYERHLSDCAGCRTSVVALARMAEADTSPLRVSGNTGAGSRESGWLDSIRAGFSVFLSPRWAWATAGLVIVAFGIPVLLWQSGQFRTFQEAKDASQTAEERPSVAAQTQPLRAGDLARESAGSLSLQDNRELPSKRKMVAGKPESEAVASKGFLTSAPEKKDSNERAAGQTVLAGSESGDKKAAVDGVAAAADESRSKARADQQAGNASTAAPAPRERAEQSTALSKIAKEDVLKVPSEDRRSVSVTELRQGVSDSDAKTERKMTATITPRDGEAPKTKGADGVVHGAVTRRQGGRALLESDTAPASRANSPQKKVGKKTFLLTKGIWTDSDFDPTGSLPIVTVVRSSDVYREMLEKNNKLKIFLTGFGENERAIFVYKSTVYKLIPQSDSK